MAGTVRCPYCVTGFEFHAMVAHIDGRYICNKCGHTARPRDAEYECLCPHCRKLAAAGERFSGKNNLVKRA